ncbi:leucine-rich repeat domain-containing protein [Flavobacterium sp. LAR06]|uniref:leucine-rich repeat domain-containing protein n=1 Tax=Flavobacterium sp. LAR06 TaxID=3064897 RepID=UPI0035BFEB5D
MSNISKAREKIANAQLSGATSLDLYDFGLTTEQLKELMPSIKKISGLTVLDLSHNDLTDLPSDLNELSTLTKLNLFSNKKLRYLPDSICECLNLRELIVRETKIKELPYDLGKLSNLESLDVSQNRRLLFLPISTGDLSNLKELNLSGSKISDLPTSFSKLSNLTKLYMADTQLEIVPEPIFYLPNLTHLYLAQNDKLRYIADDLSYLESLINLDVSQNKILTSLPASIWQHQNLVLLNASENPMLTSLPQSIPYQSNLEDLNISNCGVVSLPTNIGRLSSLKKLSAVSCQIVDLPETLRNFQNIKLLNFLNNPLSLESMSLLNRISEEREGVNIRYNMAAHDQVQSAEGVLKTLYPSDQELASVMKRLGSCDLDMVTIAYGGDNPVQQTAKEAIKEFLVKVPINSEYERQLYGPPTLGLLKELFDENTSREKRNTIMEEMSIFLGDCTSPVRHYLEQKRIGQLGKETQVSDLDKFIIERLAVIEKVRNLPGYKPNEEIEQMYGLINLVYSKEKVDQRHIDMNRPPPNVVFVGEIERNLPLTSTYPTIAFDLIKNNPELIQQFACLICETKDNKPIQTSDGHYKLSEPKIEKIKNNYIADLGLATGDQLERKKYIVKYTQDMEEFIDKEGMKNLLYIDYFIEAKDLLDMTSQQNELKAILEKKDGADIRHEYKNFLSEQQSKFTKFRDQKNPLARFTTPINQRSSSQSPDRVRNHTEGQTKSTERKFTPKR